MTNRQISRRTLKYCATATPGLGAAGKGFFLGIGVVFLLCVIGCGRPRYRAVDFEAALARAKAHPAYSDPSDREHSIVSFDVVTLGSLVPDPWSVKEAVGNIESNAAGNPGTLAGAVSLATWERTRVYLGDTFERAYASFVGGVAYWMLGEDDNGAALWRNALDIDRESDPGYQTDFGVANYLLAKYEWNRPLQRDNAQLYLDRSRQTFPRNPYLSEEAIQGDNLVILIEVGDGPRKIATGPQGSVLDWVYGRSQGGAVTVEVDAGERYESSTILDLYPQARHSMRVTGKKALQVVKGVAVASGIGYAVYKLTDDPVLGVFAAFALQLMPADTRQWHGVPAQVQLVSCRVPPGPHTLRIRKSFHSYSRYPIPETFVHNVEVSRRGNTIVLIRPVQNQKDRSGVPPLEVPRSTGVLPDRKSKASVGSPVLDTRFVDEAVRNRSPLYKYLPSREEIRSAPGSETGENATMGDVHSGRNGG